MGPVNMQGKSFNDMNGSKLTANSLFVKIYTKRIIEFQK